MPLPVPSDFPIEKIPGLVSEVKEYFGTHVTKSLVWRRKQLQALYRLVSDNETRFCDALKADLSKPLFEASLTEVVPIKNEIQTCLDMLSTWTKAEPYPTPIALLPASSEVRSEPYGTILLIAPFNYPFQLMLIPLASMIAAGNAVVIKPSELMPQVAALLTELIPKYLDTRAFQIVNGAVPQVTGLLKEKWDYIFFTGSEFVGKIVAKAAAEHLTPVTLELGGKSPVIVTEDADIALSAKRTVWGRMFNCGQTCISPDYLFVHSSIKKKFIEAAIRNMKEMMGVDAERSPDLARIVNERHTTRISKIIDDSKSEIIYGGRYNIANRFIEPTLLDSTVDSPAMREEIFGPVLPIIAYDDINKVIAFINSKPKPLALYLFTKSNATTEKFLTQTSSGGVTVNDVMMHSVSASLPFGGVGASGHGAYHGKYGFDCFSHKKAVLHKSLFGDAPARYPPYTDGKYKFFRFAAELHRVDSSTFKKVARLLIPIAVAYAAYRSGIFKFGYRSNV